MSLKSHVTVVGGSGSVGEQTRLTRSLVEVEVCLTFYRPRAPTKFSLGTGAT